LLDLAVISVKRGMPFVIAICGLEFSSLLQIAAVLPATSQKSDG
jgi:hypothetical protein